MSCRRVSELYNLFKNYYETLSQVILESGSDAQTILNLKKQLWVECSNTKNELLKSIDDPELLLLRGFLARKFGYEFIGRFRDGFAVAKIADEKYVFIDHFGERLNDDIYLDAGNFSDEFAPVRLASLQVIDRVPLMGFIRKDGSIVNCVNENGRNLPFYECHDFKNGFARVNFWFDSLSSSTSWNFLTKDLRLLSNEKYFNCRDFKNGFARVCRDSGGWNFINENGVELNNVNYKVVYDFNDNGCALVQKIDESFNFVDCNGHEKYLQMDLPDFSNFIRVQRKDGSWNFVNKMNGVELSHEKYISCEGFDNGYASVRRLDGSVGFVDLLGRYSDEKKYKSCTFFSEDSIYVITHDGLSNIIKKDGTELFAKALPYIFHSFYRGIITVSRNDGSKTILYHVSGTADNLIEKPAMEWNFLKDDETLLLGDSWLKSAPRTFFHDMDYEFIKIGDYWQMMNLNGIFSDEVYKSFETIFLLQRSFFILELADGSGKVIFDQSGKRICEDLYSSVEICKESKAKTINCNDTMFKEELKALLLVGKVGSDKKYFIDHKGRKIFEYNKKVFV